MSMTTRIRVNRPTFTDVGNSLPPLSSVNTSLQSLSQTDIHTLPSYITNALLYNTLSTAVSSAVNELTNGVVSLVDHSNITDSTEMNYNIYNFDSGTIGKPKNKITKPHVGYERWIILFPGSFDPVHAGHVGLACDILNCYGADELWMMPTPKNPLKTKHKYASKWDRFRMLEKILEFHRNNYKSVGRSYERIKPSYFEFTLKAPFYTAKTIKELQKIYPSYYFSLLIGSDNLSIFDKWKNSRWLYDNVHIIAFGRMDGNDLDTLQNKYPKIDIYKPESFYNVSSTQIRNEISKGNYDNVHSSIREYIKANDLYK